VAGAFHIDFNLDPAIVRNPPPEFRHLRMTYCPVGVRVDSLVFPGPVWCDFAGVLLLRWALEVWNLSAARARAARLIFFDTPSEIWVRRTASRWWKVSCVVRTGKEKQVEAEALCTPERVEAALLAASQRFLAGVRQCGVWGKDCEELAAFVDNPDAYVEALREAHAEQAAAARAPDPLPAALRARLLGNIGTNEQGRFPAPSIPQDVRPTEIRPAHLPFFCPRCSAVLAPWVGTQTQQACRHCGLGVRI
jgi:hypothetical protein